MRPTTRVLDVDSTLQGENVRMGIDASAIQHIIGVLTDLYADPELAVIREYSTNAYDAHRDAGNPLPIEVTLPTPLSPFFRVRDYGDGLDVEDIRSIYSQYGTSTKRNSNDVVGMLGLGCKSALTYTDQFTLVGTKNGRTVQVSIHRDEDGGGSMTIVSDEATPDAPSGVEVIVPAKRGNEFDDKARDFFRWWTPGTVLVNGKEPKHIGELADLTWLVPDRIAVYNPEALGYYNRYSDTASPGYVVMGNVAYPMPEQDEMRNRQYRIVAFVDIGEVSFTPSREALMLNKQTKETLAKIESDVRRELAAAMQKRITAAASPSEATRLAQEANVYGVKTSDLVYKGRSLPAALERPSMGEATVENTYLVHEQRGYRKSGDRVRRIPVWHSNRLVFTDFNSKEFSLAKREKFDAWLEQEGIERPLQVVCVDKLTADEAFWLKGVPTYSWEPVQAIKVEKEGRIVTGNGRPRGSYELLDGGHIDAGDIDPLQPILWVRPDERYIETNRWSQQRRTKDNTVPGVEATIIVLPANRVEKFRRDFPSACHWREYRKKEATDWLDKQDAEAVEAAKFQISGVGSHLAGLDPAQVNDPALAAAITKQNAKVATVRAGIERRADFLRMTSYDLRDKYADPLTKYPMAQGHAFRIGSKADHFYLYVNAVYQAASPAN